MTHDRRELNRVLGDRCVPKRYHYQGIPKKGGSGGKFVWGKPGDELEMTGTEEQEQQEQQQQQPQEAQPIVTTESERPAGEGEVERQEIAQQAVGTRPPKNP
jgi:hypothetical protein